jgi:Recombination endonuclease VII
MPQRQHEVCTQENCDRPHKARGYCATHYMQFKRGVSEVGEIKSRVRNKPEQCIEEGCTEEVKAKGLCKMHYQRLLRHGFTKYKDRKKPPKICRVPGCKSWLYSNGLCNAHYCKDRTWSEFGFTIDAYIEMLAEQNGVCKICERPESNRNAQSGRIKDLAVDHCHKTNKIRGLLCSNCNTAIGLFQDSPVLLRNAVEYLKSF